MLSSIIEKVTSDAIEFFNISEEDKEKMKRDDLIAYRYFTNSKALDLLATGEIYMVHSSRWEDPFEGELYMYWGLISGLGNLTNQMKFLCLSEDPESDLIWKCYCPDNSGVKIGFKVNSLAGELSGNVLGRILYVDKDSTLKIINEELEKIPSQHSHKLLFTKQRAYEGEREIRILKLDKEESSGMPLRVKIDLLACINSITINPRASKSAKLKLEKAIKTAGLHTYISASTYLGRDWDYTLAAASKHIKKLVADAL
jgi:hypothetical protein